METNVFAAFKDENGKTINEITSPDQVKVGDTLEQMFQEVIVRVW